jgi:hypothetical protein
MPNAPDTESEMLQLLIDIALIQGKLRPLQGRMDKLVSNRAPKLQRLRELGMTPATIHKVTKVPLSTVYANTTNSHRRRDGERREDV